MNTAKKVYESDVNGVVHVDVSIGAPGRKVEVLVVWQELGAQAPEQPTASDESVDDLVGLLGDVDDFRRPPQGEYEKRRPFG